ncbi:uncharacterized protein [Amphiura filiformis]|uniref:uncharacterized protein n=1 Tax=Amphiura filiformis TaxID=82378 RepID=UPI003B221AF7
MAEYKVVPNTDAAPPEGDGKDSRTWKELLGVNYRFIIIITAPVLLSPMALAAPNSIGFTAYSIMLMGAYWCTECIPLAATALFPMVLFPMFGILSSKVVCAQYMKDINVLFFSGLMIAIAVEHWNLHKRIALRVLLLVGSKPRWLMLGFMITTAFLSMWMSNTATTAMMIPIAQAVLKELQGDDSVELEEIEVEANKPGNEKLSTGKLKEDEKLLDAGENQGENTRPVFSLDDGEEDGEKPHVLALDDGRNQDASYTEDNALDPSESEPHVLGLDDGRNALHTVPSYSEATKMGEMGKNSQSPAEAKHAEAMMNDTNPSAKETKKEDNYICKGIILCVPYAANIGGTATLIGTGPNLVLIGQAESLFGTETGINFGTFMLYAFPGMVICLLLTWGWLQFFYIDRWWQGCRKDKNVDQSDRASKYIRKAYNDLGPMSYAEKVVLIHVCLIGALWLTRDPKFITGWAALFKDGFVTDSTAGMIVALSLFLMPSKPPQFIFGCGRTVKVDKDHIRVPCLLEWEIVSRKMAWNVVILLGGGFALAEACKESGLSEWLGQQFLILKDFSPEVMALLISAVVAIFTEITSNTSTSSIFLPILAALSTSLGVNPLFLMIAAAIACSFAFMLPVATPPNAIAFAYGHVTVWDMVKTGFILNIVCILVSNLCLNTLGVWIYDVKTYPDWAIDPANITATKYRILRLAVIEGLESVDIISTRKMAEYEAIPPSSAAEPRSNYECEGPRSQPQLRSWRGMLRAHYSYLIIILTPLLLSPIAIAQPNSIGYTAYCIMFMGVYWCTECIPLAATALFPMVLFPMFGILTSKVVCAQYMKDINVLFFSGLMIAIAVEHWNLHKRIALRVLLLVGSKPRWLMFGFMVTTAFLSMWMSNTATTAMMIPIAQAVLKELKSDANQDGEETEVNANGSFNGHVDAPNDDFEAVKMEDITADKNFSSLKQAEADMKPPEATSVTADDEGDKAYALVCKGIILCVPYAANIGGTATLIGTGPNLVLIGQAETLFGTDTGINFGTYLAYAFPGMVICLLLTWAWLQLYYIDRWCCWGFRRNRSDSNTSSDQNDRAARYIRRAYDDLGPMSYPEIVVAIHVCLVALLWLSRDPKFIPGWASFFKDGYITDSTAGMIVAMLLFVMPSKTPQFLCGFGKQDFENGRVVRVPKLLEWDVVSQKMAWNVVFLLGGGFALAEACKESGLSEWLGEQFLILKDFSPEVIALLIAIIVGAFTEITSNTSTASIFLPILAALGVSLGVNPLFLMISASIACSFAFMLPVATPPNAIAFAYGHVSVWDMVKTGFILNVVCILVSFMSLNTLGVWIFDLKTYPDWASDMASTTTMMTTITANVSSTGL